MKYKILGLLLSAGIVLAACGNDNDTDNKDADNNQSNNQTEQTDKSNNENSKDKDDQNKDDDTDTDNDTNKNASNNDRTIAVNDVKTEPNDAVKTAKDSFDGDVTSIEYKKDNGEWIYEIDLVNGNDEGEVKVSDADNKVINTDKDTDDDNDNEKTIKYDDAIKYEDAVKKAQDEVSGDLKKWKLGHDDNQFVYEIELLDGTDEKEVKLDAKSGDIISTDN
ncbi:PepSY domain-containing protein [Staphylococcus canis]|uniref:PepSY domain-containing protein n=1 Tax=Staphylococcus canis TaxID=2724942 RepID=A0ABS0T9I6_9STAP|nr:PepSY domain-containing protein [Staphylococcus canis]MBI5975399.1 hypothetical protein [Staphylococcus canis]